MLVNLYARTDLAAPSHPSGSTPKIDLPSLSLNPTDGKALIKLVAPADLIKARDEKRALAEAKLAKKASQADAERQKRIAKLEKGKTPPQELFRSQPAYGSFDADGIPLTDAEGKELTKNQAKKVRKEWETQKKAHEEYLAWKEKEQQQ